MKTVKIQFGPGNSIERNFPDGSNVGDVINDATVKAALGYPQNVRALIDRIPQDNSSPVQNGDVIVLETVGTSKA